MADHRSSLERMIGGASTLGGLVGDDVLAGVRRDLGVLGSGSIAAQIAAADRGPAGLAAAAAAKAHKSLIDVASGRIAAVGTVQGVLEQSRRDAMSLAAGGMLGEVGRMRERNWAAALAGNSIADLTSLMPNVARHAAEIELAHRRALDVVGGLGTRDLARAAELAVPRSIAAIMEATSVRMSMIAGVGDVAGIGSFAFDEAVHGLLGSWRSQPDLPASFWRDRRVRERHYRRADVDPGLVAAPPPVAVEIMVDSGLAAGGKNAGGSVALIDFAGVSVSIRAADAQVDGYRCVVAFEVALRKFVKRRLTARQGPNWFKRRVDQNTFEKAKATRVSALKAGEDEAPLINFTDLGELMGIVLRGDNWGQVFEAVFVNRGRFEQDMLALIALRRRTAHARIVDSPALLEAILIMKRLDDLMAGDGAWKLAAAADD